MSNIKNKDIPESVYCTLEAINSEIDHLTELIESARTDRESKLLDFYRACEIATSYRLGDWVYLLDENGEVKKDEYGHDRANCIVAFKLEDDSVVVVTREQFGGGYYTLDKLGEVSHRTDHESYNRLFGDVDKEWYEEEL